ncbi:MAG: hypothetical protein Kow0010_23920 [Dehalococcoidia bacterium]
MTIAVLLRAIEDPDLAGGVTGTTLRLDDPSVTALSLAFALRAHTSAAPIVGLAAGPSEWDPVLRETLALGVDRVLRAWSSSLADADAIATARTLARTVPVDSSYVVAGSASSDHGCGILPAAIAEYLGWPLLADVAAIERSADVPGLVAQVRAGGGRRRRYRLTPPLVIAAVRQPPPPMYPPLARRLAARRATILSTEPGEEPARTVTMKGTGPAWPRRRQLIQPSATANPAQRLRQLMSGGVGGSGGGQSATLDGARAAETLATWLQDHNFVTVGQEDTP